MKVHFLQRTKPKLSLFFLFFVLNLLGNPVMAVDDEREFLGFPREITLMEAINHISEQYKVLFNYDRKIVSDITVKYEPDVFHSVDEAITAVLKDTDLKYQIFDQRYVVLYKNDQEGIESLKGMIEHFQTIVDKSDEIVSERRKVQPAPILSSASLSDFLFDKAIAIDIQGTVTDESGEPLIGVNIQVKGTDKGTATDIEGQFRIEDIDENAILVISYIGYQTQEIEVTGKSSLSIILLSDSQLLDEVVVVGYGTQKKETLTGAVSAVNGDVISRPGSNNISHTIAGKITGISMVPTNGEPGANPQIYVRGIGTTGSSSPLIVIDGIYQ